MGINMWFPSGFTSDFASVPLRPGVYAVFGNRAHRPAVIHDYYCRTAQDKAEVDPEAMSCSWRQCLV